MRIREVDFPEPLLSAQKEHRLVVFAGAGVSIPPPSNFPNFAELADRVANGVIQRDEDESIDRFLGRVSDQGINVHELVRGILTNPDSKPNQLHFDLLRLFKSPESLRIVTTNFDLHFSTATSECFGHDKQIETFHAPALPLGDSFSGIVYLHGGVDRRAPSLVLTDRDFGRAYLTEGWARIFLQKLFSHFTVLFIGYSHDDSVMNYLARGLPPEAGAPKRFALTESGKEKRWKPLGITPISYQLTTDENKHSNLPIAIKAWAVQIHQGALEQEQRIKTVVEAPPTLDQEAIDFIGDCITQESTARFFTRHAETVAWLKWVEERECLARLFRPGSILNDVDRELGNWFVEKFAIHHVGEALALLERQRQSLHRELWNMISLELFRAQKRGNHFLALDRWLPVLIDACPPGASVDHLEYILANLTFPDGATAALLLFAFLSQPRVELEKDFWAELAEEPKQDDVKFEISSLGSEYWLAHAWRNFFLPHLSYFVDRLESIVTAHLQRARLLTLAGAPSNTEWDSLSIARNQIEASDTFGRREGIDVLIDMAYEILKWNTSNRPDRATCLIGYWFASDSQILKRLAISGVSLSRNWMPDQKINWLLDHKLLFEFGLKHEVFQLLKVAFPGTSEGMKNAILERARLGPTHPKINPGSNTWKYEIYNLLLWLHQIAPESKLVKDVFDLMQLSNPTFGKRDHPDLDIVVGPATSGWQSPVTFGELLSKSPKEQIDWLQTFTDVSPFGSDRRGLIESVTEASIQNFSWSIQLVAELSEREDWKSDLWSGVLHGWFRATLDDKQWSQVIELIDTRPNILEPFRIDISDLLLEGTKKISGQIPVGESETVLRISDHLWKSCIDSDATTKKEDSSDDWLFIAINDPAGKLATFWLTLLSRFGKDTTETGTRVRNRLWECLGDATDRDSYSASLARVVIASQLTFLFGLDPEWSLARVLPLLDWSFDPKRALQAFHGFLGWGRQTEPLVPHLIPLYVKAFPHMSEFGPSRDRFQEYLSGLACFSLINPVEQGWLTRFIQDAGVQDRIGWTLNVTRLLRQMKDEPKTTMWKSWGHQYWQRRLAGIPLPFDSLELGGTVEWSIFLGEEFPQVVKQVKLSPAFQLKHSSIYRDLAETTYAERFPNETAELLLVLFRNEKVLPYDLDRAIKMIKETRVLRSPIAVLLEICEQLAQLGFAKAGELKDFVIKENP